MAVLKYRSYAQDEAGDVISGASVEVRDSAGALASIYEDADKVTPLSNPFTAGAGVSEKTGAFEFWADEGDYSITVGSGASADTFPAYILGAESVDGRLNDKLAIQRLTEAVDPEGSGEDGAIVRGSLGETIMGVDPDTREVIVGHSIKALQRRKFDDPMQPVIEIDAGLADGARYVPISVDVRDGRANVERFTLHSEKKALRAFGANINQGRLDWHWGFGQSLSVGGGLGYDTLSTSAAALMHATPGANLMFNGGAYPASMNFDSSDVSADEFLDLVPHMERPRAGRGQTQGAGAIMGHRSYLTFERQESDAVGFCSFGKGGQEIANLEQGTRPYNNGLAAHTRAAALAEEYGLTYNPVGIQWTQGEEDRAQGTLRATYSTALQGLADDLETDWQAIYSKATPYRLFVDQLSSNTSGDTDEICLAQIDAAKAHSDIYLLGPLYQFPKVDSVHKTAKSYDLMGERAARIMRLVEDGEAWEPCWFVSAVRTGTSIVLTVNVPNDELVIDTTTLTAATNYGFAYTGAGITDVTITDAAAGEITITLDADAGGDLSYALSGPGGVSGMSGAWGNVRDSANNEIMSHLHPEALHNWLCRDQITVA